MDRPEAARSVAEPGWQSVVNRIHLLRRLAFQTGFLFPALLFLSGCGTGPEPDTALPSDLTSGKRCFLIELGLDDPKPSDWSGRLEAEPGSVQLLPWRTGGNTSVGSGSSWSARTRRFGPRPPHYWEEPTRNLMFVGGNPLRSTAAYSRLIWPGLLAVTAQPGEWTLTTSRGPLKIDARTLEPGLRRSHMAGQVTASEVPLFQVLTREGTYDDFPALAAAEAGCRVGWIEFKDGRQRILSRKLAGGAWSPPMEIREGQDLSDLQMVKTGDGGIWWIWSQQLDENWDLFARFGEDGVLGPVTRLTDDPRPDLYPRAAAGPGGAVHLVWQGFRGSQSDVLIKTLRDASWGPERRVSDSAANDWKPALAVDSSGRVHVVWDTYERGDYDLYLRQVGPGDMGGIVPVARSRNFEGYADIACDGRDRVWITWNESGPNWGKDSGFWVDQSRQTFLDKRTIRVAVYDGNRWSRPVEDLDQVLEDYFSKLSRSGLRLYRPPATRIRFRNDNELPRLIWDQRGRMWLFFRHQVSTAGDGASHRPGWEVYGVFYQGSSWSTPMLVPRSTGRLDMPLALDASTDGTLWMSWLTDHRSIHDASPDSRTLQEDVVVGRLEPARNGEMPRLKEHQPREETIEPFHRDEPGDLTRIRSYRVEVEGRTYRIVRGDMHRHTDYSQDGGLDGSLHETYRYALDAASLDFLAVTDHYPGEYVWWETQKSLQRFYLPGRFVPLLGYERNLGYPNGHRNVVFAGRGAPMLDASSEERSGQVNTGAVLYDYLRKYDGLAMPHTPGTPTMGTDWRDHAEDVEPLVEIFQGDRTSYERPGAPLAAVRDDAATHRGGYLEEGFVWKAWEKGYRLGVQASSDHWSTHYSYACLLVERFDAQGLMDAMRRRHAYAATDNIVLDFRAEEGGRVHIMGDAFDAESGATLRVHAEGTGPVADIVLIRDNRVAYTRKPGRNRVDFSFLETDPEPGTHFYYVRLQQADGHVAWSSPIWITYR